MVTVSCIVMVREPCLRRISHHGLKKNIIWNWEISMVMVRQTCCLPDGQKTLIEVDGATGASIIQRGMVNSLENTIQSLSMRVRNSFILLT